MKNNMFLLLRTSLANTYKLKAKKSKKIFLWVILYVYVFGILITSAYGILSELYKMLSEINLTSYYMTLLFILISIISFVFTIFAAKSWLFDNKDNDLLLSLPVKRSDILGSRVLQVTLYNFLIGLLLLIPGVYIAIKNMTIVPSFIIITIIMVLFFSIIPTVLACLFGYLIASITSRAKSKNLVELLSYILFIAVYFAFYFSAQKLLLKLTSNIELLNNVLKFGFFPIYLVGKSYITGNIIYVVEFVLLSVFVLYIFLSILKNSYFKIISKSDSIQSTGNYKMSSIKESSINKALIKKEFSRYFSSAIYVFNTAFGPLFIIIAAVGSLFYSFDGIVKLLEIGETINPFMLVFGLMMFSISLSNIAASSISIERDNFWILKMLPVKTKTIFFAKRVVNEIMLIPVCLISLVIFKISGYVSTIEMFLLMILSIVYTIFIANWGLIVNLLLPKLDATNDTIIVKQSAASFLSIFSGLILFILYLGTLISLKLTNVVVLLLTVGLSLILLLISRLILNKWGVKRFMEIN